MKAKKAILFVVSVLLSCNVQAQEVYGSAGMGLLETDEIERVGFGTMFRVGYLLSESSHSLGIEAEINPLMVKPEGDTRHSSRDMAMTLGSYLVYNLQIPDTKIIVRPKAGLVLPNWGDRLYRDNESFAYGLSLSYYFDKELGVYASYGSFGSGVKQYSIGIELLFR